MLTITLEMFNATVPAAISPDESIFRKVLPSIERRARFLRNTVIGRRLFDRLTHPDEFNVEEGAETEARGAIIEFCCLAGFLDILHQLDLVITPNGFGIVSNQNVAPASKERVESLRDSLDRSAAVSLDELLLALAELDEWADSHECRSWCQTIFWRPGITATPDKPTVTLTDWEKGTGPRLGAQLAIGKLTGNDQAYDFVRRSIRSRRHSSGISQAAVNYATDFARAHVAGMDTSGPRRALLGFLTDNIDSFPVFRASRQYKALKSLNDERNSADEPGFVFY